MRTQSSRLIECVKIVFLCIIASVVYGTVHDQITVRLCPAYFTEWYFHAEVFQHPNLTVVGLFWGIVATWWVGLILGVPIAIVSIYGAVEWWTWRRSVKPLVLLIISLWITAAIGYWTSILLSFRADSEALGYFPETDQDLLRFSSVLVAHNVSYVAGAIGGLLIAWWIHCQRKKLVVIQSKQGV